MRIIRLVSELATGACLACLVTSTQAAQVITSDFIADSNRTNFNGFESIGPDNISGENYATYVEGGIRVTQVNQKITGYVPSVGTTFMAPGFEGGHSWYANGGDYGFTSITMADGSDFQNVGFLRGSGWVTPEAPYINSYLYFELWHDGALVQSGKLGPYTYFANYVGFSGGGFDEIKIRDSLDSNVDHFGNGAPFELGGQGAGGPTYNALAVDNIEVMAVPEPAMAFLFLAGMITLSFYQRKHI